MGPSKEQKIDSLLRYYACVRENENLECISLKQRRCIINGFACAAESLIVLVNTH